MIGNPRKRLIVGLGNPTQKYKMTYHNVGNLFIEYLKDNYHLSSKIKNGIEYYKLKNIIIISSPAYMNESGGFVKKIMNTFTIKPNHILIAHDDSDILLGSLKTSFNRGSAGHKGIISIISSLGTKRFGRLRVGTRKHPTGNQDLKKREKAEKFVLKKISDKNLKILYSCFSEITENLIENENWPGPERISPKDN